MKIWTFNNHKEIDISVGNLKLQTINYGSWKDGKPISYSELHLWYSIDCGYCACSWDSLGIDGECIDSGCYLARKEEDSPAKIICMLPNCIKKLFVKIKFWKWKNEQKKYVD